MTRNQKIDLIQIRRGVALYRVGRSPYWHVRIYNSATKKYVVRSTRETGRVAAKLAAEELVSALAAQGHFKPQPVLENRTSFDYFAQRVLRAGTGSSKKFAARDDERILLRPVDGLVAHFGQLDIRTIKTSAVRDYLQSLNERRAAPLSDSTLAKHVIVMRKVFNAAVEDGTLATVPALPKQTSRPRPRPSFSDEEYKHLLATARAEGSQGVQVMGRLLTMELPNLIEFMVGSFVRPLESELFSLRLSDIEIREHPKALHLSIHDGKNGARTTVTMPECVDTYHRQIKLTGATSPDQFFFFPHLLDRSLAVTAARQMFNHVLGKAALKTDPRGEARQLYSLRHYSIQKRIMGSGGVVNIYMLAKNAGTSVEMIEKFYAKFLAPSSAMIENLHFEHVAIPRSILPLVDDEKVATTP